MIKDGNRVTSKSRAEFLKMEILHKKTRFFFKTELTL